MSLFRSLTNTDNDDDDESRFTQNSSSRREERNKLLRCQVTSSCNNDDHDKAHTFAAGRRDTQRKTHREQFGRQTLNALLSQSAFG